MVRQSNYLPIRSLAQPPAWLESGDRLEGSLWLQILCIVLLAEPQLIAD